MPRKHDSATRGRLRKLGLDHLFKLSGLFLCIASCAGCVEPHDLSAGRDILAADLVDQVAVLLQPARREVAGSLGKIGVHQPSKTTTFGDSVRQAPTVVTIKRVAPSAFNFMSSPELRALAARM